MAKIIKPTSLGKFLHQISADKRDIHFKTGILYSKIIKTSNNNANLTLVDFYLIAKSVENNELTLETIANRIFENYIAVDIPKLDPETGNELSKFGQFIIRFLNSKKTIGEKFNMSPTGITKSMLDDQDADILGIEVYSLCKYFNQDFIKVTQEICEGLMLNSVEKQEELRKEYQFQLAQRKQEREDTVTTLQQLYETGYFKIERTLHDVISGAKEKYNTILKSSYVRTELDKNSETSGFLQKISLNGLEYYKELAVT